MGTLEKPSQNICLLAGYDCSENPFETTNYLSICIILLILFLALWPFLGGDAAVEKWRCEACG